MFVHDQTPPGVPLMKEKGAEISYHFEERMRSKLSMTFFVFRSRITTPAGD